MLTDQQFRNFSNFRRERMVSSLRFSRPAFRWVNFCWFACFPVGVIKLLSGWDRKTAATRYHCRALVSSHSGRRAARPWCRQLPSVPAGPLPDRPLIESCWDVGRSTSARVGHDCVTEHTLAGAGRASPAHTCPTPWRREFSGVLSSCGLCSAGVQRCVQTSPPTSPSSWWPPLLPYGIPWQGWAQRARQLRPPHPPGSAAPCPGPLLPNSLMEGKTTLEENAPCPPHPGWLRILHWGWKKASFCLHSAELLHLLLWANTNTPW